MRVLFVARWVESLGLEYLSAVLKDAGHQVDMIFDPDVSASFFIEYKFLTWLINFKEALLKKIKSSQPDLIGFSCVTSMYPWVSSMAKFIKENFDIPIIVGGIHATILPELVINNPYVDFICIGEGEYALLELVDRLGRSKDVYSINNIWAKKDGKIYRNAIRPPISNLDELPFADKDIFYEKGIFKHRLVMMASRGCLFHCSYCANCYLRKEIYDGYEHNFYRMRSVRSVIDEIKHVRSRYRIKDIHFADDLFPTDLKWIREFSRAYKKEIGVPFYCLVRPNLVREEAVALLKEAGCKVMRMGVESGDPYILRNILKRNMTIEQIKSAIKVIKKYNIKLEACIMFGLPQESKERAMRSISLLLETKPDNIFTYIFTPYPKTELAEYCFKNGYLDRNKGEELNEGIIGRMHQRSVLKIPDANFMYNLSLLAPLAMKLKISRKLLYKMCRFKKGEIYSTFRWLSIILMSPWESIQRAKESIGSLVSFFLKRRQK